VHEFDRSLTERGKPFLLDHYLPASREHHRASLDNWKGFGIGSEFRQTGCAANNFRVHEVLLPWFKGGSDYLSRLTLGRTHGTLRTPAVSVRALRYFNLGSF
jgi:hypothetical protein